MRPWAQSGQRFWHLDKTCFSNSAAGKPDCTGVPFLVNWFINLYRTRHAGDVTPPEFGAQKRLLFGHVSSIFECILDGALKQRLGDAL
jgi:hypothetical protein